MVRPQRPFFGRFLIICAWVDKILVIMTEDLLFYSIYCDILFNEYIYSVNTRSEKRVNNKHMIKRDSLS